MDKMRGDANRVALSIAVAISSMFFTIETAMAQGANLGQFTIGDRAFGMGGAFVALSDDATAGWYNPGGLGEISGKVINASGNAYYFEGFDESKALEIGSPSTQQRDSADLKLGQIGSNATTLAYAAALQNKDGSSNQAVGFGFYVPRAVSMEDEGRSFLSTGNLTLEINQRQEIAGKTIYFGPSYGIGFGGKVGIGISPFLLYSNASGSLFLDQVTTIPALNELTGVITSDEFETTYWGLRFNTGIKYEQDRLNMGLAVMTPSVRLSEHTETTATSVSYSSTTLVTAPRTRVHTNEDTTDFERGWLIRGGIALVEKADWAVEADLSYYVPKSSGDIADENIVNIAIGGEKYLNKSYVLRAGIFTDFSGQESISSTPIGTELPDIDIYGFSTQLTHLMQKPFEAKKTAISLGLSYSYGKGDAVGLRANTDTLGISTTRIDATYENLTLTLSGTISY